MIGSSTFIQALAASLTNPDIENRLTLLKKTISAVEQQQIKNTARLSRSLVKVLVSVKKDPTATPDQLALVADFKARIGLFDPRNEENRVRKLVTERRLTEREQYLKELGERIPKVVKQQDGYEPGFLNVTEAIERVVSKYSVPPPYTDLENQRLLETFLGDSTPLSAHSASQISLHLAQEFKARGDNYSKTFTSIFPPLIVAVQTALCQYVNSRNFAMPSATCLSMTDDLGFRS